MILVYFDTLPLQYIYLYHFSFLFNAFESSCHNKLHDDLSFENSFIGFPKTFLIHDYSAVQECSINAIPH